MALKSNSGAIREKLYKSVMRYLREPDRWTAFASLLLKSMAFLRSLETTPMNFPSTRLDAAEECKSSQIVENLIRGTDIKSNISVEPAFAEKLNFPIVDLPRTEQNRPYLPILQNTETENHNSTMNVSHQYPYVCIVQQHRRSQDAHDSSKRQSDQNASLPPLRQHNSQTLQDMNIQIGIDAVVFNFNQNEYNPTVEKCLSCFEKSFTPWEWNRINYCHPPNSSTHPIHSDEGVKPKITSRWWTPSTSFFPSAFPSLRSTSSSSPSCFTSPVPATRPRSDSSKLREFFLRWAVKEAYTKSLGLGLLANFESFETILLGVDMDDYISGDGDEAGDNDDTRSVREDSHWSDLEEGIWNSIIKDVEIESRNRTRLDASGNCGSNVAKLLPPSTCQKIGGSQYQFSILGQVRKCSKSSISSVHSSTLSSPKEETESCELWEFTFIPLGDDCIDAVSTAGAGSSGGAGVVSQSKLKEFGVHGQNNANFYNNFYNACACICRGPFSTSKSDSSCLAPMRQRVVIEWLSLLDLIQLHCSRCNFEGMDV